MCDHLIFLCSRTVHPLSNPNVHPSWYLRFQFWYEVVIFRQVISFVSISRPVYILQSRKWLLLIWLFHQKFKIISSINFIYQLVSITTGNYSRMKIKKKNLLERKRFENELQQFGLKNIEYCSVIYGNGNSDTTMYFKVVLRKIWDKYAVLFEIG